VPGVHRISGVRDGREAARVVHAGDAIAGVGNTAPKAMVGWWLRVQACPRRRSVGACDEPADRRGGQAVFAGTIFVMY
jgi:hypothetical protein